MVDCLFVYLFSSLFICLFVHLFLCLFVVVVYLFGCSAICLLLLLLLLLPHDLLLAPAVADTLMIIRG